MTATHTPTPYTYETDEATHPALARTLIHDAHRVRIADHVTDEATAAFIVRACNHHDLLIRRLEDARSVITMADRSEAWKLERARCLSEICAVLKLAKGEA